MAVLLPHYVHDGDAVFGAATTGPRLAVVLILLCCCAAAHGLVINPIYVDAAGQTWNSDPARKAVINQAITEWESVIHDDRTINVTFTFANVGTGTNGYLGLWKATGSISTGANVYPWTSGVTHTVTFNTSYFTGDNYLWWDATPTTGADLPAIAWDALSVTRHELGHMLGFSTGLYFDNYGLFNQTDRWTSHISGDPKTFDAGGLNVRLAANDNLSHLYDGGNSLGDLMIPQVTNGERTTITQLDVSMLILAHGYNAALASLLGDFNGDGSVNDDDFVTWTNAYGTSESAFPAGTCNNDGVVDQADYTIWADNYGLGRWSATAPVPEPTTLAMLVLAAVVLKRHSRR